MVPDPHTPHKPILPALIVAALLLLATPLAVAHPHDPDPPPPGRPYMLEFEGAGLIGCAVAFQHISAKDYCAEQDPNANSEFTFPLDPYLTTMVFVLESKDSQINSALTAELVVNFRSPPGAIETIRGPAPLFAYQEFDRENNFPGWEDPPDMEASVRANNEADTPQFAFQQPIRVCVGLFYRGAEVPDFYNPCRS